MQLISSDTKFVTFARKYITSFSACSWNLLRVGIVTILWMSLPVKECEEEKNIFGITKLKYSLYI